MLKTNNKYQHIREKNMVSFNLLYKHAGLLPMLGLLLMMCVLASSACHGVEAKVERTSENLRILGSIGKEIHDSCKWKRLVVLCDKDFQESMMHTLNAIKRLHIPFAVFAVDENESAAIIYNQYVHKEVKSVIIVSKRANIILDEMNELFLNYSKSFLSAFPHRSSWILVTNGSDVNANQSKLDNVALLKLNSGIEGSIKTLMWREDGSRQWDTVDPKTLCSSDCRLFPNKKNGLNGRNISWLITPFSYGVYVTIDDSGNPQYAGYFIDIVNVLGNNINSTTVFVPPPTSPLPGAVHNYDILMRNKSADFGMNLYSQGFANDNGLQGMYHLFLDPTVAAYVYKPSSGNFKLSLVNFGSFPYPIQVIMCGAFVYAVGFYKLMSFLAPYVMNVKDMRFLCDEGKTTHSADDTNPESRKFPESSDVSENRETLDTHKYGIFDWKPVTRDKLQNRRFNQQIMPNMERETPFVAKMYRVLWHAYHGVPDFQITRFLGSHFNQSTIMRPENFSLRLFIFFWCFYVLLITCLFTGTLTANLIRPKESPPFTSVPQILQSSDVTYGTFEQTELADNSQSWIINGKDWEGELERYPITFTSKPKQFREFMEQPTSKLRVFVYYRHVIKYLKYKSDFDDLYITEDYFHHGVLGFVTPKNSEIADFASRAMARLHESRISDKMSEPYLGPPLKKRPMSETRDNYDIEISVLKEFFYFIILCTVVAAIALCFELLIYYAGSAYMA